MKLRHFVVAATLILSVTVLAHQSLADHRVTGKFLYEDRDFGLDGFAEIPTARPIRFAEVRIMEGATVLATGATDARGEFSVPVSGSGQQSVTALCIARSGSSGGPLLAVRVANDDFSFGDYYAVSSAQMAAPGAGALDMGSTIATSTTDAGKAFNIWDVAVDGLEFVASSLANGSMPAEPLTVTWRADHARSGSFFSSGRGRYVYIGNRAAYDDTVVSHELGHFIDHLFSKSDSPGGQHFIGDGDQDIRLSWSEGLATFLGSWMRKFKGHPRPDTYVSTDGSRVSFSYELETLDGNVVMASKTGSTNEAAVSAALWDITDGPGEGDDSPGTDDDPLERPFSDVWEVLTRHMPLVAAPGLTVEDFWDGWFSTGLNKGFPREMETTFAFRNGIEFLPDPLENDDAAQIAPRLGPGLLPRKLDRADVIMSELDLGRADAVELYNPGSREVDLAGWKMVAFAPGYATVVYTLPSFRLGAGAFVTIHETSGINTAEMLYVDSNISWANDADGACALLDASGKPRDFIRWGKSAEPPPAGFELRGPNPTSPPAGRNLARALGSTRVGYTEDWRPQIPSLGTYSSGGHEIHHTFYPREDADWGSFAAVSGTEYLFEMLNAASGAQPVIEIMAGDGVTVLSATDPGISGRTTRLRWTASGSGMYYARARRSGAPNYADYGSYDLRILVNRPLTVSKSGDGDFRTVAEAVAAAYAGDIIEILDSGTYFENIVIATAPLTVRGIPGRNPTIDGSGGPGPAVHVSSGDIRIESLRIRSGSPALLVSKGKATVVNATVLRSSGRSDSADGLRVAGADASAVVVNSLVTENQRAGLAVTSGGSIRIVNSIVASNALGDVVSDGAPSIVTVRNSLIGNGGFGSAQGNLEGDPSFADPAGDDFRLLSSSPAIDRGDSSEPDFPAVDADGVPRALDGDGNGSAIPDLGPYEHVPAALLASSSVSAQIALGGAYETSIQLVNPSGVASVQQIALRNSAGEIIPFNTPDESGRPATVPIPAMGTARRIAGGGAFTMSGYATLAGDRPPEGSVLFRTAGPAGRVISEAAVQLAQPQERFLLYVDNRNDAFTGYALANSGDAPALLDLILRNRQGFIVARKSRTLAAGKHIAEFVHQDFGAAAPQAFEGSLLFTSDRPVSAVALRYDNRAQDVFSTSPVLPDDRMANSLYFPQLADGGGYRTMFILINPSAGSSTTVKLEFLDSGGGPLSLSIAGQYYSDLSLALGPGEVRSLRTDGNVPFTRTGWARVTSISPVGGAALLQLLDDSQIQSEAGIASSPPVTRFSLQADSRGFAASGVALCNPAGATVVIKTRLWDQAGHVVGAASFPLRPGGHIARFFTEWFPEGFAGFEGTLDISASSPIAAMALRYDNEPADVFSAIPVIVMP